jgi:hypothetical protein
MAFIGQSYVKAQCDEKLVDKAIAKSGNDALFIREFVYNSKVQEKKKKDKAPSFSAKYDVRLNKGIVYRFIIENEDNSLSQAFLQLRKNNLELANTYDVDNHLNIGNFDYLCNENGSYQVLLSFVGENTGCAAGAMFAIMQDSLSLYSILDSSEIKNVIYTGIDNYIDIAASNISDGSLEVTVDRGTIEEENGLYKIHVEEPGKLVVDVVAKDKNGKITETFKSEFSVVAPSLPTVTLGTSPGGIVKKNDLLNKIPSLEINNDRKDIKYKLKRFDVSKNISVDGISNETDNRLSFRQLNIIKDLNPGETFYITNIIIEDSKGKIYRLEPLGFILSD